MNQGRINEAAVLYFGDRAAHWDLAALGARLAADGYGRRSFLAAAHREYTRDAYEGQIKGGAMYEIYERLQPVLAGEADLTTEVDFKIYQGRRAAGSTPRHLLADPNLAVSPLFKYVMCVVEGFYDLAAGLAEKAKAQVEENPYYIGAWPEELLQYFPYEEET